MKKILNAIKAGYCFIYIKTDEQTKTRDKLKELLYNENSILKVSLFEWDFSNNPDPDNVMQFMKKPRGDEEGIPLCIAINFNWFLKDSYNDINKDFVSTMLAQYENWCSGDFRKVLIIISEQEFEQAIPDVLKKMFFAHETSLPDEKEIEIIYTEITEGLKESKKFKVPNKEKKKLIISSAKGLPETEIKNAFVYSIIENEGVFNPKTVAKIRGKEIEKIPGLKLREYKENFNNIVGYDKLKTFVLNTYKSPLSKGIILVGPPGCGKTMFAKCFGGQTGLTCIEWEMAQMMGDGLVGQAEKATKKAIDVTIANAPAIVFIDELEKGLSDSSTKNGKASSGTAVKSNSQILKFLSDNRPEGLYVIATCNNIRSIDPEWLRAERWDSAPWFVDLPSPNEQKMILDYYKKFYNVKGELKNMVGWSGAEIKSVCRIASMMGKQINEVKEYIIPISHTMENEIKELKQWSDGRTINSTTFQLPETKKASRKMLI